MAISSVKDDFSSDVVRASGSSDVAQLRVWLRDPRERRNYSIRGIAAMRLGELRDKDSEMAVAALLGDHLAITRMNAAGALGRIGSAATAPMLVEALGDSHLLVRTAAADSLGHIGDRSAREALRRCLEDESPYVRFEAVYSLVRLKDPDARMLVQQVWDKETALRWGRRRIWRDLWREVRNTETDRV